MTNEQHIENLKKLKSFHNGSYGADIDRAIKALEQTRWIPVSEKLPKLGEEVLVCGYDTYNKKVIVSRYQGKQYGFTCGLVSAWMPLPELYKAESEEEQCE